MKLYSVYDNAVLAFMPPFSCPADGAAMRSFIDAVNDVKHDFNRHAMDYDLYRLGDMDDAGVFVSCKPVLILSGSLALIRDVSPK